MMRALGIAGVFIGVLSGLIGLATLVAHSPRTAIYATLDVAAVAFMAFVLYFAVLVARMSRRYRRRSDYKPLHWWSLVGVAVAGDALLLTQAILIPKGLPSLGVVGLLVGATLLVVVVRVEIEDRKSANRVCPRCAEEVRWQATTCRFCAHEFGIVYTRYGVGGLDRMSP
jgi:uncharacterized membrane protein YfcA